MDKIFVYDKAYVPLATISNQSALNEHYAWKIYEEQMCSRCEYLRERHCEICDTCPANQGTMRLWTPRTIQGVEYVGLPIGDKRNFERVLGINYSDYTVVDKRVRTPFSAPITFTGELRDYQVPLVKDFLEHKYGLIVAGARSGKTACSVYIATQLGCKTLVLANQIDFLKQFETHIATMTDLPQREKVVGHRLYGIAKTVADFEKFDISLTTYQTFLSEQGQAKLAVARKLFGTVMADECHKVAAMEFSKVFSKFCSAYRFGVTATPERKDGKEKVLYYILGPVTSTIDKEMLNVQVEVHNTGVEPRRPYNDWVSAMKFLATHVDRNVQIVDQALDLVAQGRCGLIPVTFRQHVTELVTAINQRHGSVIAEEFVGGGTDRNKKQREAVLERARAGTTKVVVGIRSLMQLGLDVPIWSFLLCVCPIANRPNLKQETSRIRTPMVGKPAPLLRIFADPGVVQSIGCFRATYGHLKSFVGYRLTPAAEKESRALLSKRFDDSGPPKSYTLGRRF